VYSTAIDLSHHTNVEAQTNSVPECAVRDILTPKIHGKIQVNNKTLNRTPHVDVMSGVSTETGDAAINALVPNLVTCVVPKPLSLCTAAKANICFPAES